MFDFDYFDMAMRGDCIEANEDVLEKKQLTIRYNEMTNQQQQALYNFVSRDLSMCPNGVK